MTRAFWAFIGLCGLTACSEPVEDGRQVPPTTRDASAPACTAFTAKHSLPVYVISYLPSADGSTLDADITGVDGTLDELKARVDTLTTGTVAALEDGSRYHGYADRSAPCSLNYEPIAHVKYVEALPAANDGSQHPDYMQVLEREDICNLVEEQGVQEVWLWGYQHGNIAPTESNMAGPHGDISNSDRTADMPVCESTYTLYNYNYGRGVAEAVHDHGHRIENVLYYVAGGTFDDWRYPILEDGVPTSCGDVHTPPNGQDDYDYADPTPVESDCLDWQVQHGGATTKISCEDWGCGGDPQLQYLVWWMQNLPGRHSGLLGASGQPFPNWWDAIADFDDVVDHGFEPESDAPTGGSGAQCDALGYGGACLGDTSAWSEDGACRIRDCTAEGKQCGFISSTAGWGCLGGTDGATTFDCSDVGYDGACMADDTLVWAENGACRVVHCPDRGQSCGDDPVLGHDCIDTTSSNASGAQCDALGYSGACFGATSVWSEDGACRVRDCAAEGRSCGLISDADGSGCLGGTDGATTFDCGDVGYQGACTADDTLVWVEGGECRAIHCPDSGRTCGLDEALGYDCM